MTESRQEPPLRESNALKTLALVLVCIILIVSLWVHMAALSVERTVLSSAYYRGLFTEADIPAQLHAVIEEEITGQLRFQLIADAPAIEVPDEVKEILMGSFMHAFDQAWFERELLLVIDDFLAMVKGKQETLQAEIDLRENKRKMAEYLTANLKVFENTFGITEMFLGEGIGLNGEKLVREMSLPDRIMPAALMAGIIKEDSAQAQAMLMLQTSRSYFLFVPYLVIAALFLLNHLLAGTYGGLKWSGAAFLVAATTFFLGLRVIEYVFVTFFVTGLRQAIPFGSDVFINAAQYTVARASTVPIIIAAIGLILLVGSTVVWRKYGKLPMETPAE